VLAGCDFGVAAICMTECESGMALSVDYVLLELRNLFFLVEIVIVEHGV
jgi:hypothetical protein